MSNSTENAEFAPLSVIRMFANVIIGKELV